MTKQNKVDYLDDLAARRARIEKNLDELGEKIIQTGFAKRDGDKIVGTLLE